MYSVSEQLVSANKAGVETLVTITNAAFGGVERLAALNLNTVRTLLDDSAANTRALLAISDIQAIASLPTTLAKPGLEKASAYSRSLYQIATETQQVLSDVVEARVAELGRKTSRAFDKASKTP